MLTQILFLGSIGAPEVIVILAIALLFFGGKKIPELMKGVGKGVRAFKDGLNKVEDEIKKDIDDKDKED